MDKFTDVEFELDALNGVVSHDHSLVEAIYNVKFLSIALVEAIQRLGDIEFRYESEIEAALTQGEYVGGMVYESTPQDLDGNKLEGTRVTVVLGAEGVIVFQPKPEF